MSWIKPNPAVPVPSLKLYNSLTRQKEEFIPKSGRRVTWYNCGPTVYDASHMGHARVYLTFDILRRVLESYFNYDVMYVMNITDIDDKIILRARQNHLFEIYRRDCPPLSHSVIGNVETMWKQYALKSILSAKPFSGFDSESLMTAFETYQQVLKQNREAIEKEIGEKFTLHCSVIENVYQALVDAQKNLGSVEHAHKLIDIAQDVIAPALDKKMGTEVSDHGIFKKLTQYWEDEYFNDMKQLNIKPPDVLTRVTEYVPEIVAFVQRIIDNGYAYESQGSVYFSVEAFKQKHGYAKLAPWASGHSSLLNEGEGSLGIMLGGKKSVNDFALWKASKPGEPSWDSPWGQGRPGWHIECSAMATDITGSVLDIHSGGIDLCFPHHDNELAQTEAYYGSQQWVNYFLHAGHLHIDGQKMSKSLKNFITIKECLDKYTPTQMRLMILLHSWNSTLDYKDATMTEAISIEHTLRNFFETVKAHTRDAVPPIPAKHNFNALEKEMFAHLTEKQDQIHEALCDNINTHQAMLHILDLINKSNTYMREARPRNVEVLSKVARYVRKLMNVFGVTTAEEPIRFMDNSSSSSADTVPYVSALSQFRDKIRQLAKSGTSEPSKYLIECDDLRDTIMPELGVSIEDVENSAKSLIKFVPASILLKQRQEKADKVRERAETKQRQAEEQKQKRIEKLLHGKAKPEELFKTAEWSKWDEQGLPTHGKDGQEVSRGRKKKLGKEQDAQVQLHRDYLAAIESGELKQ